jgi:uncharacterized protein YecE (DUF72 family)
MKMIGEKKNAAQAREMVQAREKEQKPEAQSAEYNPPSAATPDVRTAASKDALTALESIKLMSQMFAGTSGWAYPNWKPDFYPAKLAQKNFLNYYATQLNTVEVNFTFRQLVKESTIQNWMRETPSHFRFGVKAHQVITHIKRLKDTQEFIGRFLATIEPLAASGKLAAVLFQLPPNLKADSELLKDFLAILPRTVPAAFEFRHDSWFADSTWSLLKANNVAVCVAETETRTTPDVVTGEFAYYRFRKPTYTGEERRAMLDRIEQHVAAGRNVYAYFKHEDTPDGALYAAELLRSAGRTLEAASPGTLAT